MHDLSRSWQDTVVRNSLRVDIVRSLFVHSTGSTNLYAFYLIHDA